MFTAGVANLCCLKTTVELENIFGNLYTSIEATNRNNKFGFASLRAIEQSGNDTLTQIMNVSKTRVGDSGCTDVQYSVKFIEPDCADPAAASCTDILACTDHTNANEAYLYADGDIDLCADVKWSFDLSQYDCSCENPDEEWARIFANKMHKLRAMRSVEVHTAIVAGVGSLYGDSALTSVTPLPLKLFRETSEGNAVPQPMGMFALEDEFDAQLGSLGTARTVISGSKKIAAWNYAKSIFAGNVDGADNNRVDDGGVVYDRGLKALLVGSAADEPLLAFANGAIQVVDWHSFASDKTAQLDATGAVVSYLPVQASGNLVKQTIDVGTALYGFPWFVDIKFDYRECDNVVHIHAQSRFAVAKIPQTAFCSGDTHNYCILADIVCADVVCADLCEPVA